VTNPILVEVVRGTAVESRHRGAVAVYDADGTEFLALGDVANPIFPRSAVKPLQALLLVESGAADDYGLADQELAIACASHGGEAAHVAAVESFLARGSRRLRARVRRALAVAPGVGTGAGARP
jgi:L-asparaginase II